MEALTVFLEAYMTEAAVVLMGLLALTAYVLTRSPKKQQVEDKNDLETSNNEGKVTGLEHQAPVEEAKVDDAKEPEPELNFFLRGLAKSRALISSSLNGIFGVAVDEEALEQLEELLLFADVGDLSFDIVNELRAAAKTEGADLKVELIKQLRALLAEDEHLKEPVKPLHIILVVGVNGSGKTTTIGKLAHRYVVQNKKVMVAAGDTFRAGAAEQLKVWAERSGSEFVQGAEGADPSSVVYQAIEKAKASGVDILICDTAGRLQANKPLMDELSKVVRVIKKQIPEAPHEGLLVLDSTIGQNALFQAQGFGEVVDLTGVALTKLDGTAKGGIVFSIRKKIGLPVKLVGLGEGIEDLRDFNAQAFVDALIED